MDPVTQSQGTQGQAPASGAAGNNPQGTQQQGQDPAWFQHIPDQYREEAKKSYLLHSDYTKKSQELSEQRKQWESEQQKYKDYEQKVSSYDKWWGDNKSTFEAIQKNWERIAPILQGQAVNTQNPQNNGQSSQNYFENWDVLPAQEQAQRLAEYVASNHLQKGLSAQEQKINQLLAQKEQQIQNYLAILTDAYGKKFENPSLNIPEYIKKATEYSYGQFNPMDLAYQSMTGPASLEKMKEEWLAKGREEARLEAQNAAQSTGAFNNVTIPTFRGQPKTRSEVTESVRAEMQKKGFGW